jgi:PhnB protein
MADAPQNRGSLQRLREQNGVLRVRFSRDTTRSIQRSGIMSEASLQNWRASGRSVVSTFVVVPQAMRVVEFAKAVFGAHEIREPLFRADGSLWNVELDIGGSTVMLGDAPDQSMCRPAFLYVHVEDCDATYAKALAAGAKPITPPQDQFYGDRDGGVEDMAGNSCWIATHKRDLSAAEIERGAREVEAKRQG